MSTAAVADNTKVISDNVSDDNITTEINGDNQNVKTMRIADKNEVIKIVLREKVGFFILSLSDISNEIFVNTRGDKTTPQHISNISGTLGDNRNNQQLHPLNCALHKVDDEIEIGVYEGFTRYEAACRNALADLIDKWNKVNKLSPKDSDYIIPINSDDDSYVPNIDYRHQIQRNRIKEAGGEWLKEYNEAMSSYPIKVEVIVSMTNKDAFIKGVIGNYARQKPNMWSMVQNILAMINKYGMKGTEIAKKLKVTPALVSQYKSVGEIPDLIYEIIDMKLTKDDPEYQKTKSMADICIDEFIRRASLPMEDRCSIQISSAKLMSSFMKKFHEDNSDINDVFKLVRLLCCISPDNKLSKDEPTLSSTLFEQRVQSLMSRKKAVEIEVGEGFDFQRDVINAIENRTIEDQLEEMLNGDASEVAEIEKEVKEDEDSYPNETDEILKAIELSELESEEDESDEDEEDTEEDVDVDVNVDTVDTVDTEDIEDTEFKDDEEGELNEDIISKLVGSIEDDSIENDSIDDDDHGLDSELEDLVGSILGEDDDEEEKKDAGQRKSSTIEVKAESTTKSVSQIKSKIITSKLMLASILESVDNDNDPTDINWIDILVLVGSIVSFADIINDTEMFSSWQKILTELSESVNNYNEELIKITKNKGSAEEWNTVIKSISPSVLRIKEAIN
jgi:predicted transcriptional regulator